MTILDSNALKNALAEAVKLTGKGNLGIRIVKDTLYIEASDGTSAEIVLNISVSGKEKAAFTVDSELLRGVINNRGEIEVSILDNQLVIKATKGRYSAKINIESYSDKSTSFSDLKDGLTLSSGVRKLLLEVLSEVAFVPVFDTKNDQLLALQVKISRERTLIACLNANQSSIFVGEGSKNETEFTIPSWVATSVFKDFLTNSSTGTLHISDSSLFLIGETSKIRLNYMVSSIDLEKADFLLKMEEYCKYSFNTKDFNTIVDNFYSIADSEQPIRFAVKGNKARLSYKTDYGEISDSFIVSSKKLKDVECLFSQPIISAMIASVSEDNTELSLLKSAEKLVGVKLANKLAGGKIYRMGMLLSSDRAKD